MTRFIDIRKQIPSPARGAPLEPGDPHPLDGRGLPVGVLEIALTNDEYLRVVLRVV